MTSKRESILDVAAKFFSVSTGFNYLYSEALEIICQFLDPQLSQQFLIDNLCKQSKSISLPSEILESLHHQL